MGGAGHVYSSNHHYQAFFNLSFVELRSPRPSAPRPPSASGLTSVGSLCRFHGERCPSASLVRTRMWGYLSPLSSFTRASDDALCTKPYTMSLPYLTALYTTISMYFLHFVTALCDCNLHCHLNAHSALCTMSLHYITAQCHCTMSLPYVTALCHCTISLNSTLPSQCTLCTWHFVTALYHCTLHNHLNAIIKLCHCTLHYHLMAPFALCTISLHYVTVLCHCTLHYHLNALSALCHCTL